MKILRLILKTLAIAFIIFVAAWLYMERIPPVSQTYGAIHMCKRRIQLYAMEHNALPSSLSEIEEINGYDNSIKDAWGHPIIYNVDKDGLVTLTSLGRDNKPSGIGDNRDMVGIYPSRRPDGKWSDEMVEWSKDPFKEFRNRR